MTPVLRYLFRDFISLEDYLNGKTPTLGDIKRRLILLERENNIELPDHYYKNAADDTLCDIKSLPELFTKGLVLISENHLEVNGNIIYIKNNKFNEWQNLLTLMPPLTFLSTYLWKKKFNKGELRIEELRKYIDHLYLNLKYTSYPSPYMPQMESILENSGFYDLHCHLNGSTETDVVWQSMLKYPNKFLHQLNQAYKNEKIKEQIEQEHSPLSPYDFYRRLITAQRLRMLFVHIIFNKKYTPELIIENFEYLECMKLTNAWDHIFPTSFRHPISRIFNDSNQENLIYFEALMHALVLDKLSRNEDEQLAAMYHEYLLILGFINKFLVQQFTQKGFDQFQKFTLNEFRTETEKNFVKRFLQLNGNRSNYIKQLEGRISPKESPLKNLKYINKIEECVNSCSNFQGRLKLVAHFIKTADNLKYSKDEFLIHIRHRALRIETWIKAHALVTTIKNARDKSLLVGIDAASNELEAPPEVFAPSYRFLRSNGVQNFTYHAGEDFHHLIGGLRAIYEAIEFLDLHRGNRIGHATAAGIEPTLWLDRIENMLYIRVGEWLDDLLFAYYLICLTDDRRLLDLLYDIEREVYSLTEHIYSDRFSIHELITAWSLRKYCPFHMLYDLEIAQGRVIWNAQEWDLCHKNKQNKNALKLLELYHIGEIKKRYNKIIPVKPLKIFNTPENLFRLQEVVLREMYKKEIILESLPTSNLRISFYRSYKEHHLWRWLGIKKTENHRLNNIPPVVLGTDDAGIFATNIFNEFCHVFDYLTHEMGMGHNEALGLIKRIHEDSEIYRFRTRIEEFK